MDYKTVLQRLGGGAAVGGEIVAAQLEQGVGQATNHTPPANVNLVRPTPDGPRTARQSGFRPQWGIIRRNSVELGGLAPAATTACCDGVRQLPQLKTSGPVLSSMRYLCNHSTYGHETRHPGRQGTN